MKPKTARRYLARNRYKIKKKEIEQTRGRSWLNGFGVQFKPKTHVRSCLRALRRDIRETKNPASIRAYNDFMYR